MGTYTDEEDILDWGGHSDKVAGIFSEGKKRIRSSDSKSKVEVEERLRLEAILRSYIDVAQVPNNLCRIYATIPWNDAFGFSTCRYLAWLNNAGSSLNID